MVRLGLEEWSTWLNCSLGVITYGISLGQVMLGQGTRPNGQAVRVMVWLGLESWSTRLNCSLGVSTRSVSLGQVRLGIPALYEACRRLESLFGLGQSLVHTVKLFPRSHPTLSIFRLGQVSYTSTLRSRQDPLGRWLESWFGLGQSHGQTLLSFLERGCKNRQLSFQQLLLI